MIANAFHFASGVDIAFWFWLGAAFLGAGCLFFLVMGVLDGGGHENHFTTSFFINLIATTTYLAMAFGMGKMTTHSGATIFYARYIDWMLTTPLLLLNLCMVATFNVSRKSSLVAGLIGMDAFMIGTGFLAAISTGPAKWTFFGLSCFAFGIVMLLLWGVLRAEAAKLTWGEWETYNRANIILTVLWLGYPVVFLLGGEGLSLVSQGIEAMVYMVLDVCAKFGFGLVLLSAVRRMVPKQAQEQLDDVLIES